MGIRTSRYRRLTKLGWSDSELPEPKNRKPPLPSFRIRVRIQARNGDPAWPFSVELPGIEPDALPGLMPSDQRFRSVSFLFSPARYLRKQIRFLTASKYQKGAKAYAPVA
jgi:hypothetical protein